MENKFFKATDQDNIGEDEDESINISENQPETGCACCGKCDCHIEWPDT